jgi:hypothetical protein
MFNIIVCDCLPPDTLLLVDNLESKVDDSDITIRGRILGQIVNLLTAPGPAPRQGRTNKRENEDEVPNNRGHHA